MKEIFSHRGSWVGMLTLLFSPLHAQRFVVYNTLSYPTSSPSQVINPNLDSLISSLCIGNPRAETLDLFTGSDTIRLPPYSAQRSAETGVAISYDNNYIVLERTDYGLSLRFVVSSGLANGNKIMYLPFPGLYPAYTPPTNTDYGAMNNTLFFSNSLLLRSNEPGSCAPPLKADTFAFDTITVSSVKIGETYVIENFEKPLNNYLRIYIIPNKHHGVLADTLYFVIPTFDGKLDEPDGRDDVVWLPGGPFETGHGIEVSFVPWWDSLGIAGDSILGVLYTANTFAVDTSQLDFETRFPTSYVEFILNKIKCLLRWADVCFADTLIPITSNVASIPDTVRIPFHLENATPITVGYNLTNMWAFIPKGFAPMDRPGGFVSGLSVVFTAINPRQFAWPRANGSPAVLNIVDENGNEAIVRIYYRDIQENDSLRFGLGAVMYASDYPNQIVIDKVEVEWPIVLTDSLLPGQMLSVGWHPTSSQPVTGAFLSFPQFMLKALDTFAVGVAEGRGMSVRLLKYDAGRKVLRVMPRGQRVQVVLFDGLGRRIRWHVFWREGVVDLKSLPPGIYHVVGTTPSYRVGMKIWKE